MMEPSSPRPEELVEQFRKNGGQGKLIQGSLKVCWGTDREEAIRTVHARWSSERLPGELNQILPTPRHFEQANSLVTKQMIADSVACGDDVDAHVGALRAFVDTGFDHVYVGQVGPEQRGFFDFYPKKVLPQLAS
jgi:G6PDH family F420-dependent oxidoreductase